MVNEGGLDRAHPLSRATVNVLENFREAYYVAARAAAEVLPEDGMTEKSFLAEIRKNHRTGLLLGELIKPESANDVGFKNAINRFAELGFIRIEKRGRGGRDRWIVRDGDPQRLDDFVDTLAASVGSNREMAHRAPATRRREL